MLQLQAQQRDPMPLHDLCTPQTQCSEMHKGCSLVPQTPIYIPPTCFSACITNPCLKHACRLQTCPSYLRLTPCLYHHRRI